MTKCVPVLKKRRRPKTWQTWVAGPAKPGSLWAGTAWTRGSAGSAEAVEGSLQSLKGTVLNLTEQPTVRLDATVVQYGRIYIMLIWLCMMFSKQRLLQIFFYHT